MTSFYRFNLRLRTGKKKPKEPEYKIFQFHKVHAETDSAIRLEIKYKKVWLPKSRVMVNYMNNTVRIPTWISDTKELY